MAPRIEAVDVSKAFGAVQALKGVSLEIAPGEVHALVGENGAGKSTLLKVLAGEVTPDSGSIAIGGRVFPHLGAAQSRAQGIALVHQEYSYVSRMSVSENMALTVGYPRRGPFVAWRPLHRRAQAQLDKWNLNIDVRQQMTSLTPPQHVAVACVTALELTASILILDEPSASFSAPEVEHLHAVVSDLRREGHSVVYVTHRLDEVFAICDRVTIMRDGTTIATRAVSEITKSELIEMIVGHPVVERHSVAPAEAGVTEDVLRVDGIADERVGPLSFRLRKGEILGFAGLVGAGRTELFELLYGIRRPTSGTIRVDGRPRHISSPAVACRLGMGLVPEERRRSGIIRRMSVRENVVLPTLERYAHPVLRIQQRGRQKRDVGRLAERVRLRTSAVEAPVDRLSGGNQQKVVIGRWLNAQARILLFDEPARGVDVGAKEEIFELVREVADEGAAVLVASSEHEELVGLCHRVIVMREGKAVEELVGEQITEEAIAQLCFQPAEGSHG